MDFRLDKSAFKRGTHKDAGNDRAYWLSKSPEERFEAAWYLISHVYGFEPQKAPSMEKKLFSTHRHEAQ